MSTNLVINAELRDVSGTGAVRRLRKAEKVPAVIYGAGKDNQSLTLGHDDIYHKLEMESFHSAILDIQTPGGKEQAILRAVQMHPYKPRVLHVDFQRISATEKIHISIPVHFLGEEEAPGVRIDGGIISHLINDVDISCLPKDLPEHLEIDVSNLGLNESLHLTDIKLPEGVEITSFAHGGEDLAVVAINPPKIEVEEEVEDEELEEGVEAEVAEGETPEDGTGEGGGENS